MRLVCCHVPGQLYPETEAAIAACVGEEVEIVYRVLDPSDDLAYGDTLAREWRSALDAGEDLAIVEPDIVIDESVMHDFLNCPCEYGGRPYSWGPEIGIALGCTRFRHSFMAKYPTAMVRAAARMVSWRQFDVVFQRHILVRELGEQPHLCGHGGVVEHLNPLKQLRPDARLDPVVVLPAW